MGSVRQLVDPSQTVQMTQTFDPFGQVLEQVGSAPSSFGYTGEQTDPTDLVFLRARYYDPALGRFLTADSIIPDPLSSQGWNRYAYVSNNPIRYADPSGHQQGCPAHLDICQDPWQPIREMWEVAFGPDGQGNRYPQGDNTTVFIQVGGAIEADVIPGAQAGYYRSLAFNFATGNLTELHTVVGSLTASTPEGVSGTASIKYGRAETSTTDNFLGPSRALSFNASVDTGIQAGYEGEVCYALEDFWTSPEFWQSVANRDLVNAYDLANELAIDDVTGNPVVIVSRGPFIGINIVPNGIEFGGSVSPGTNYTWKGGEINLYIWKWFIDE